jgi:hypothetical protein
MKAFGASNTLEFYGEIAPLSQMAPSSQLHDQLNYALIRGLHQFGGDDLDLWLVSNPSKPNHVSFNIIARPTLDGGRRLLANRFRASLMPLTCSGP